MEGTHQRRSLRKSLIAGFLLGVVVLLNAAVVVPALHYFWHDDHTCDDPDCVVLAMVQGTVDSDAAPAPSAEYEGPSVPLPESPASQPSVSSDCPPLPGRAPPVYA
ncbi:MAG: hypothetical protein JNK85_23320 [Verrucomicrobiales bacterium]|nr:hypothetical protein [Verrucomicrobiales bacterium]